MSSIIRVDTVKNTALVNIKTSDFRRRSVQRISRWFRGGLWNPGNTYYEIPGSFINITPFYDNSLITYVYMCPIGQFGTYAHSITHWIFMANGMEYARHSRSMEHQESGSALRWEVPSWGRGVSGSLGYITRQYSSGSHCAYFNGRRYIDGTDATQDAPAFISVEEYLTV